MRAQLTWPILAALVLVPAGCGNGKSGGPAAKPADKMVRVPAGQFQLGCAPHEALPCARETALPRTLELPAYDIDVLEVTAEDFRACVSAKACSPIPGPDDLRPRQPALVNWAQATAYCRWLGKDLPIELQWEKAARGSDGRAYPWGDTAPTCNDAHYRNGCGSAQDADVGSYSSDKSPYGAFDMLGNAPSGCLMVGRLTTARSWLPTRAPIPTGSAS